MANDAIARQPRAPTWRGAAAWVALGIVLIVPIGIAASSPLLEWRGPIYIAAGFAGVIALALLPLQPLLATDRLPGLSVARARRLHRGIGIALLAAVVLHVAGLWLTSPPDVVDALLLRSPTPFSSWGVIAMWALVGAALAAAARGHPGLRSRPWRVAHAVMTSVVVIATVLHALLIEGTMGTVSKAALCVVALGTTGWGMAEAMKRRMSLRRGRGSSGRTGRA